MKFQLLRIRNPIAVLIELRERVRTEHIVPNVVGDIKVRLPGVGNMAGVETTKPRLGHAVTRLESLAHCRPGQVEHCSSTHTAVNRRPRGQAGLRRLKKAAVVWHNPVIQAVEGDDGDLPRRPAGGRGGVERRRHRGGGGENIRSHASHSMGHETAVR
jgi:hypothetical protein